MWAMAMAAVLDYAVEFCILPGNGRVLRSDSKQNVIFVLKTTLLNAGRGCTEGDIEVFINKNGFVINYL